MSEKLKTVVVYCEERFRKECRHLTGKIEFARVVLEVNCGNSPLAQTSVEEIQSHNPQLFIVEFPKDRQETLGILTTLHESYPLIPIIGAGERFDSEFLIETMRLGLAELLPKPLLSDKLSDAFERIRRQCQVAEDERESGTVISFFSPKGGSGSTSIATNFAVSLSQMSKKKVLVLDLDLELGEVASFFGINHNKYLLQECEGYGLVDPSAIARSIVTHPKTGVDILSISDGISEAPASLAIELKQLLFLLQGQYDYVVVDTSGTLSDSVVSVLDASHLIFLVSKCNLPSLRNVQKVLNAFERLGYSQSRVRLLINRYSKGEDISVKEIEKALKFNVFWWIPNDYKTMIRSIQSGVPLTTNQYSSEPLAKSFYAMSSQIVGIEVKDPTDAPKSGLLVRVRESSAKSLPITSLNLLKN